MLLVDCFRVNRDGGGDKISIFGRTGVDDHLFNRRDRGRTLLRTACPLRPRRLREPDRLRSEDRSSAGGTTVLEAGKGGTDLKVSLSINSEGERGPSPLGKDCATGTL
jgi:hypothetical protein